MGPLLVLPLDARARREARLVAGLADRSTCSDDFDQSAWASLIGKLLAVLREFLLGDVWVS